ncbi:hypothetical protein VDGE_07654 [Verticillium dahliae]|uniref:Hsp70-like protein n=1 Tax=Verticillium dahliae TaxID=27337 RepID=A0A444S4P6_VERDA|nr:hypothetical protein VDGE_07654 [Verticillium dahliae]
MDFEELAVSERKIIVGIDSAPLTRAKTIREGESSDKVPTKLRYSNGDVQWGFSIPVTAPQKEIVEWFKLDLDPTLQGMGNTVAQEARAGRSVNQLVTDFISSLGEHLRYMLRMKLGEHIVSTIPLEFCVTVPAIWSELAKHNTKQACQKANGLVATPSHIHLVSEPEAAAIYALHGLDPHGLKMDDTIVVVDAGGGTVDLILYTITRLKPILEVEEAAPGSGTLCGSTFLNKRFKEFLTARLGNEEGFDDEVVADAIDVFEKKIKRQFTMQASPDDRFMVPVGGLTNNKELGISRGRLSLKVADLQTIFEPIILECIKLERIRNAIDRKIRILQPPNAWQAVVQGAVMKGLAQASPSHLTQVRIQNRRARKHYGTRCNRDYDETLHGHLRDKRRWSGLYGCYRVNVMKYIVLRGDVVSETDPYCLSFVSTGLVSDVRINNIQQNIYADGTSSVAPVEHNDNTKLLCRVEADVSHIPEAQFNRRQGQDGQAYYELEYELEARVHSASTEYTLVCNNQRYNTITAEYV